MKCPNCRAEMHLIVPPEWDENGADYYHCEDCGSDWSECGNCEGAGYFGEPPEDYSRCEECDGSGLVFEA